jgi:hypothetical protein
MAQHQRFTIETGVQVFFCDPKSPWQRGSNENTNGLLRQYLPRRLDFRTLTQADLDAIADELNGRPRQERRMTDSKESREDVDQPRPVHVVAYLWEEYRYRHDLVWQLVFRVTAVATILLITPFIVGKLVQQVLGYWLLLLPTLAIAEILVGYYVLLCELDLLDRIRDAYRFAQNDALDHLKPYWRPHEIDEFGAAPARLTRWEKVTRFRSDHFADRVSMFLLLILCAAIVFFLLFLFLWLPDIT